MHYICSLIGYLLHVNKLSSLYSIGIQYHNTVVLAKKKVSSVKKKNVFKFLYSHHQCRASVPSNSSLNDQIAFPCKQIEDTSTKKKKNPTGKL